MLANRSGIAAVRSARGVEPNSLYAHRGGGRWGEGKLLASEPLDDSDGRESIPADHRVTISGSETRIEPVEIA